MKISFSFSRIFTLQTDEKERVKKKKTLKKFSLGEAEKINVIVEEKNRLQLNFSKENRNIHKTLEEECFST